ncbi:hypothetical protein ACFCZT_41875 [Streptomyces sp. NPDC056230]|uniref:hypothetical protein n=1 Tax=Streptomyces sp. NPDC056230 TaxID=3345754 RepID=UPI0035D71CD6
MPDLSDTHDLESFAIALADELFGNWHSEYHLHEQYPDQFAITDGVWDMNMVSGALAEYVLEHDAVLTRDNGTRLYVIGRPRRYEEYLVAAMAPHGFEPEAFHGVREPVGIAVEDDPVLAASDAVLDLLPRYDKAVAQVQRNGAHPAPRAPAPAPAEQVVMTWFGDGLLTAKSTSQEAAKALHENGFTWDPGKHAFVLSSDDTAHQARCVRKAGAQLATHGIGVVMRHPQKQPALETKAASPARAQANPATHSR